MDGFHFLVGKATFTAASPSTPTNIYYAGEVLDGPAACHPRLPAATHEGTVPRKNRFMDLTFRSDIGHKLEPSGGCHAQSTVDAAPKIV